MGAPVIRMRPRPGRAVLEPAPAPLPCTLEVAACALSALGQREVTATEVLEKAIGLGLIRTPAAGEIAQLSTRTVSRLLLAGYHWPAQVEAGTLRTLTQHLRAGGLAFVLLEEGAGAGLVELCQVHGNPVGSGLLLSVAGAPAETVRPLVPETFTGAWAATRQWVLLALRRWQDLPTEGDVFFGGGRDRDGTYHWDGAEYTTDAAGRILRC